MAFKKTGIALKVPQSSSPELQKIENSGSCEIDYNFLRFQVLGEQTRFRGKRNNRHSSPMKEELNSKLKEIILKKLPMCGNRVQIRELVKSKTKLKHQNYVGKGKSQLAMRGSHGKTRRKMSYHQIPPKNLPK